MEREEVFQEIKRLLLQQVEQERRRTMDEEKMKSYEGKTTFECLIPGRSEEWRNSVANEVKELREEYAELFTLATGNFLDDAGYRVLTPIFMNSGLTPPIADLCMLYFTMGYTKGVQVGEDRTKLDQLWK